MKLKSKNLMSLAAGALLALGAVSASAFPITLTYLDIDPVGATLSNGGSVSGMFDIKTVDSSPVVQILPAGLGGYTDHGVTYVDVKGYHPDPNISIDVAQATFYIHHGVNLTDKVVVDLTGSIDDGTFADGTISKVKYTTLTGEIGISALTYLSSTGKLGWDLTFTDLSVGGGQQITLDYVKLEAEATRTGNQVPDGGATAMLLGLGVMGLGVVQRRIRKIS